MLPEKIWEELPAPRYRIEMVDLLVNSRPVRWRSNPGHPHLGTACPPVRKISEDLSNSERALVGLNLLPIRSEYGTKTELTMGSKALGDMP